MCLIIYSPDEKGKLPKTAMQTSVNRNSDGAGVMYVEDGRVKVDKIVGTMKNLKEVEQWCLDYQHKLDRFVMHHRMSTDGADTMDNCHPFKVLSIDDGDPIDLYMMHNGIINACVTSRDAERSDTRVYVEDFLTPMLKLNHELLKLEAFHKHIEEYIGTGNKLTFMTSDDEVYIVNEDQGDWHECIQTGEQLYWLSNSYSTDYFTGSYGGYGGYSNYDRQSGNVVRLDSKKKVEAKAETSLPKKVSGASALMNSTFTASTSGALALADDMELWEIHNQHWIGMSPAEILEHLLESGNVLHQIEEVVQALDPYSQACLLEAALDRIYTRDYC